MGSLGDSSHLEIKRSGRFNIFPGKTFRGKQKAIDHSTPRWYFSQREMEENSPSLRDGIDSRKETILRKSYCIFLKNLGMTLKVPQLTIATAMIYCHRFFLHQSHAKNDWKTIATACMFIAAKVDETFRLLRSIIPVSYKLIHNKDPFAAKKIKQKKVYEQQKELLLLAERNVLVTLDFDLVLELPYKPLIQIRKKLNVPRNFLAKVAWNLVNDGLRTSVCLQYKPQQVAASALHLAAKFLKVQLPSEDGKTWWQEFDLTSQEMEDIDSQLMAQYDLRRPARSSHVNMVGAGTRDWHGDPITRNSVASGNLIPACSQSQPVGDVTPSTELRSPTCSVTESYENNKIGPQSYTGNHCHPIATGSTAHEDMVLEVSLGPSRSPMPSDNF